MDDARKIFAGDPRVTQYWDGRQSLGRAYGKVIELPRGRSLAWDIYLLFEAGVIWGDAPPLPTDWQHQLGVDDRYLDGGRMRKSLEAMLAETGPLMDGIEDPPREGAHAGGDPVSVQLLAFPSCPNAPELRERLTRALARLEMSCSIVEVDLETLDADDSRLRYGAPTILVNGRDLMGAEPMKKGALCCRTYEQGALPDLDELCVRLAELCSPPSRNAEP